MQIVHVIRQFHPGIGGMETVVQSLAREQVKVGHLVRVVTLDRIFDTALELTHKESLDGIEIVRVPFRGSKRYPIAISILKHIKDASIVHVHGIDFLFDYLAVTSLWHKKPMIVSTHGGFFHTQFASALKQIFFRTVTRLNLSRYGYVAASSKQDLNLFARIRAHGLGLVANGVDFIKFSAIQRSEYPKQLIYFGRFAPNKNLGALMPLIRSIRQYDPAWRLLIVGRPMGVSAEDLYALAEASSVLPFVRVAELPSDAELRQLIGESSIFVSPSSYEGFGIAALEALSGGLLLALSDIPAHRETAAETENAILLDFQEPQISACRILSAFPHFKARPKEKETRQHIERYSWEAVSKKVETVYEDVAGQSHRLIVKAPVAVMTREAAVLRISSAMRAGETLRVAFVNAHLANHASAEKTVARALQNFLLLNDGVGVDLASVLLFGRKFPANLNGTDFTPLLLDNLSPGLKIFLLGSTQRVIEQAARYYVKRWPQHNIVGYYHGFFECCEGASIAKIISNTKADLVLVGMGCPRQELWLYHHIPNACRVGLAVGALFDFQTGNVSRAPISLQKWKMEWLYRLSLEPRRLAKRYTIGNAAFAWRCLRQWLRGERAQ